MHNDENRQSLERFATEVARLRHELPRRYERQINRDLARQQWQELFLRNAVGAVRQTYSEALTALRALPFARQGMVVDKGLSPLTSEALIAFDGLVDEFLQYAVQKHRTSCALSNFPDEHKPSPDYVNEVARAIAGEWREFALQANAYLVDGGAFE